MTEPAAADTAATGGAPTRPATPEPATPEPATPDQRRTEPAAGAVLSAMAASRSVRLDRFAVGAAGVLAVLAGAAGVVVSTGQLGTGRASRPLADPIALDWLRDHQLPAQVAALALGAVLLVLGLVWALRSVRPEPQPDLVLDGLDGSTDGLRVIASAIADAIRADAETVHGVSEARVRVVGVGGQPALRLQLSLRHGADVRAVWNELDEQVLDRARRALGVPAIPIAVRLELGSAQRQRVR